jgi:hypothetical protein
LGVRGGWRQRIYTLLHCWEHSRGKITRVVVDDYST